MTTTQEILDLAAAGLAFINARKERLRLKRERNEMRCELQDDGDYITPRSPACFQYDADGCEDVSEWCETCQKRNVVHIAYHKAATQSGVALRRLVRVAEKFDADSPKQENTNAKP